MTHHPIHPPLPNLDEKDYEIAYLRWCLLQVDEYLFGFDMARKESTWFQYPGSKQRQEDGFHFLLNRLYGKVGEPDREGLDAEEPWRGLRSLEDFKSSMKRTLSGPHEGDCVSECCTCLRCYTEEILFRLPSTVTWETKSKGARLYREYREANKK